MSVQLNSYINFKDNAQEAMEFYHDIFGGKLTVDTMEDFNKQNGMETDPKDKGKLMHASLEGDNGITIMAADTPGEMPFNEGTQINMSLVGNDKKVLTGYWEKLSEGGDITMPLDEAPWGASFGMLTDKFGIPWMVNIDNK